VRLVLTGAGQSEKHPPDGRDLVVAAFDELAIHLGDHTSLEPGP
jgi:hypothetical protein